MPGELFRNMAINDSQSAHITTTPINAKADPSLYLIARASHYIAEHFMLTSLQSIDDIVYEQDILRDPGSVKPWLTYVDFKHQHGTLLEQAYVG